MTISTEPETFSGFESTSIEVEETRIFCLRKGVGRAILLLHGFPQTHLMWHRVAPTLAEEFTVVCADLRGYGSSGKPPSTSDHAPYSKSAMAADMVQAMQALGFDRFCVVGHDRGARVAYRMALDHPDRVERLAVLDIVPTSDVFTRADARFAMTFWPWSLLVQPEPLPERMLLSDPQAIVDNALGQWGSDRASFPPHVRKAYVEALGSMGSAHAICEEYRAAATIDCAKDRRDQDAGRRIGCPTLVLWSAGSSLDEWYADDGGPLGIWSNWCDEVTGRSLTGGHFFPEQNAAETISELQAFLR
jgi:haloacetate dehalogenase